MLSTFTGIELGKRGLLAHTQGFITVGHNLDNAGVEGYSRQRVIMTASDPIYQPGLNREMTKGHIGQGVEVERVERIRNLLLEDEIISKTGHGGYWDSSSNYLQMVAEAYNEPTEHSVRTRMDQFWEAWQELSTHPSETAARRVVLERGTSLVGSLNNTYKKLRGIGDMIDGDVTATVDQVNATIRLIASLSEQIEKAKALGDNPNDLYDKRDNLVEELGTLIDISVVRTDPDEFIVYTNSRMVVQGRVFQELDIRRTPENEGYAQVVWKDTPEQVALLGGKLKSLLDVRDNDVRGEIQKLDVLAMNFVDLVNEVHRKGFGLNGKTNQDFFKEIPFVVNVNGNYDRNGDGAFDATYVFRLTGANRLKGNDLIGIAGRMTLPGPNGDVFVEYFPTDTVADVMQRINFSGAEVTAHLNGDGKLSLKAVPNENPVNPDFVIRHAEDSGEFLIGYAGLLRTSGAAGAYDWNQADAVAALRPDGAQFAVAPLAHPSAWIAVNPVLTREPATIASAFGANGESNGPEDGSAAMAIADLRKKQVMVGEQLTFDDYFADAAASIGIRSQEALKNNQTQALELKNLHDLRESISGVNIDEEMTQMIKFQHGYNAAARIVTEFDRMLDVIINRMGV
ncbi:MAG: flagellar hook-associated protein FlgK [Spirochaetales bacterium]|nr:flagellar hook-associated protein FlgK [Spirochaetales bacterium]